MQNETSAQALATEIVLRGSEEWALERYLTMDTLEAVGQPTTFETLTRYDCALQPTLCLSCDTTAILSD